MRLYIPSTDFTSSLVGEPDLRVRANLAPVIPIHANLFMESRSTWIISSSHTTIIPDFKVVGVPSIRTLSSSSMNYPRVSMLWRPSGKSVSRIKTSPEAASLLILESTHGDWLSALEQATGLLPSIEGTVDNIHLEVNKLSKHWEQAVLEKVPQ